MKKPNQFYLAKALAASMVVSLTLGVVACTKEGQGKQFRINTTKTQNAGQDWSNGGKIKLSEADIQFATDYEIAVGEDKYLDYWRVSKEKAGDVIHLEIWGSSYQSTDPKEYIRFEVYDSSADAKNRYNKWHQACKEYDYGFEEGENWFVSDQPGVCDAGIRSIYYLKDNVVLSAELAVWSEWAIDPDEETEPVQTTEPIFDTSTLRAYVIEHAEELRDYVLGTILTPEDYSWALGLNDSAFASDYDLKVGETMHKVKNTWDVSKSEKDGRTYLTVSNPGADSARTLNEQLTFEVYDSRHDALEAFEELYSSFKETARDANRYGSHFTVEFDDENGVSGDTVTWMYRYEDNVIMSALVWKFHYEPGERHGTSYYNNRKLTDYIEDTPEEARKYVMEEILGG